MQICRESQLRLEGEENREAFEEAPSHSSAAALQHTLRLLKPKITAASSFEIHCSNWGPPRAAIRSPSCPQGYTLAKGL